MVRTYLRRLGHNKSDWCYSFDECGNSCSQQDRPKFVLRTSTKEDRWARDRRSVANNCSPYYPSFLPAHFPWPRSMTGSASNCNPLDQIEHPYAINEEQNKYRCHPATSLCTYGDMSWQWSPLLMEDAVLPVLLFPSAAEHNTSQDSIHLWVIKNSDCRQGHPYGQLNAVHFNAMYSYLMWKHSKAIPYVLLSHPMKDSIRCNFQRRSMSYDDADSAVLYQQLLIIGEFYQCCHAKALQQWVGALRTLTAHFFTV